jgi:hypothetical protein
MDTQDIISLIIGLLGIGGAIFAIYFKMANPQNALEKEQIKTEKDLEDKASILSQKEAEGKANILEQQFKWERKANEKRFCDMTNSLKDAMTLAQNHIHTVDTKVDGLKITVEQMGKDLVQLSTIINERIPKK